MSIGLLDLYPRSWRDRYGEEFAELLEARPPSLRDRVDIIRGAIDASLHPRLAGPAGTRDVRARDRVLALSAVAAGALFTTWAAVIVLYTPRWGEMGAIDNFILALSYGAGMLAAMLGMLVLLGVAFRHVEDMGALGLVGAALASLGFLAFIGESGSMAVVFLCGGTVVMSAGLGRALGRMTSVALVVATLIVTAAMFGFAGGDGQQLLWLWLLLVYGPSWMLLGIQLRKGVRSNPWAPIPA